MRRAAAPSLAKGCEVSPAWATGRRSSWWSVIRPYCQGWADTSVAVSAVSVSDYDRLVMHAARIVKSAKREQFLMRFYIFCVFRGQMRSRKNLLCRSLSFRRQTVIFEHSCPFHGFINCIQRRILINVTINLQKIIIKIIIIIKVVFGYIVIFFIIYISIFYYRIKI
jgi:hypothetical protein